MEQRGNSCFNDCVILQNITASTVQHIWKVLVRKPWAHVSSPFCILNNYIDDTTANIDTMGNGGGYTI